MKHKFHQNQFLPKLCVSVIKISAEILEGRFAKSNRIVAFFFPFNECVDLENKFKNSVADWLTYMVIKLFKKVFMGFYELCNNTKKVLL